MPPRRVLIVKLSSLGDVVLALPVATALKHSDPAVHITWAVEEQNAPLVASHPAIDRVVVFPTMRWSRLSPAWLRRCAGAARQLRAQRYDVSIDLQGLARSAALVLLASAPLRIGAARQREGAGWVSRAIATDPARPHAADEYLRCAVHLGAADAPARFALPVQADAAGAIARHLAAHGAAAGAPLVVVNPSASAPRKTWGADAWVALIDALPAGATVALIGDGGQVARHRDIAGRCARRPLDLTGQTTLPELVALLVRCAVHVAPDTGSVHIAAALGRPVVGLYGPTDARRHSPYAQPDGIDSAPRPCGILCPTLCRRRPCLQRTTPAELAQRASHHIEAATAAAKSNA